SIFDADEFGEGSLKHPMSVDPVKAAKYDAFFEGKLPIEALRQASELRIANSKDFGYVLQDVAEDKERLDKNEISINKEKRQADASRIDAENKERKAERIDRYASIREAEKDLFTIYTITQDNFTDQELTLKADISEEELRGMTKGNAEEKKTAKELKEEEEAKKLEYPHTLNPYERETVSIVQDLIAIEKTGKPVAISKVAPAKRAGITPVQ
ncbi:MAG: carboxy terminal-processing peptidase, partial [Verrucomicrobiota bacterium]